MYEIPDFVKTADVPQAVFDEYEGALEPFLIDFWRHYGLGTAYDGYLRVIDPLVHLDALGTQGIGKVSGNRIAIPVLATAMSDLITLDPGHGLVIIRFRDQRTNGLFASFESFIDMLDIDGAEYFDIDGKAFNRGPYAEAVERDGVPAYGTSYLFTPLPSLGGPGTAQTLKVEDTLTAVSTMIELQGPVEH